MSQSIENIPVKKRKSLRKKLLVIFCVGFFLLLILAIKLPCLISSRRAANEEMAIARIRTIRSTQEYFAEQTSINCGNLSEIFKNDSDLEKLTDGEDSGYKFIVENNAQTCSISAIPLSTSSGTRSFYYSNEDNWANIHYSAEANKVADKNSPTFNN